MSNVDEIALTMCKNYGNCNQCMLFPNCDVKSFALRLNDDGYHRKENWTSVNDGLPKKDAPIKWRDAVGYKSVKVLCVCKQKSGKIMVKEGFCEVWGGKPYWKIPGSIDSVTHWMPMPEPPQEDE